jgi:WD40 repeat protein
VNKKKLVFLLIIVMAAVMMMITACSGDTISVENTPSASVTSTKTLRPTRTATSTPGPTAVLPVELSSFKITELPEITFSNDGNRAYLNYSGHLEIMDAKTFKPISDPLLESKGVIGVRGSSPDGTILIVQISEPEQIALLDLETKTTKKITVWTYGDKDIKFSADSNYAIYSKGMDYANRSCGYIEGFSYSTELKGGVFPFSERGCSNEQLVSDAAISPDGTLTAGYVSDFYGDFLYIWDVHDRSIVHAISDLPSHIISVDFSPDGNTLVSLSEGGNINFWNPLTGQKIGNIPGVVNNATKILYTENSSTLLIESFNEKYTYNITSGVVNKLPGKEFSLVEKHLMEQGQIQKGLQKKILLSPDGNLIALVSANIQIRDVLTGNLLHTFYDEEFKYSTVIFSSDSKKLALIQTSGNVYIWDMQTGDKIFSLNNADRFDFTPHHELLVDDAPPYNSDLDYLGMAFSPDGKQIAFSNASHIEIWDIESGRKIKTLDQISSSLLPTKLSFSADGEKIYAVLNLNQDVAVWDSETGKLIKRLNLPYDDPESYFQTVLYEDLLAREYLDGEICTIEIRNLETNETIDSKTFPSWRNSYQFTKDKKSIVGFFQTEFNLWNLNTGEITTIPIDSSIGAWVISNDNRQIISFDEIWGTEFPGPDHHEVSFLDISSFTTNLSEATKVTATPVPDVYDENGFYIGNADEYYDHSRDTYATQIVETLDVPTLSSDAISKENANDLIRRFNVGHGEILKTRWSYDGLHIHVISSTGYYLLDAATLSIVEEKPFYNLNVTGGTILTDRKIQICGTTTDGTVEVRDALSGELLLETIGSGKAEISPNGKWLVYELSSNMGLWNLRTNMSDHSMFVNISKVHPVFSPDSNSVAIIVGEDTVEIWDIPTGIQKQTINFDYTVDEVKFSENAHYLIISQGRQAHFWDINKQEFYKEIDFSNKLEGDPEYYGQDVVHSVAINHKLTELAVNTEGRMIWHYDMASDKKTGTVAGTDSIMHSMEFSPDDSQLLSVDENGRLTLWETRFWKKVAISNDFVGGVLGTTWIQNGTMAAWSANRAIAFNSDTGEMTNNIFIPESKILDVSQSENYIAGNTPHRISIYDLESGIFLRRLPIEADFYFSTSVWGDHLRTQFYGANFSSDGKHFIAYGSGGIWMIDPASGSVVSVPEMNYITCKGAISPDGEFVVFSYIEYQQGPYLIDFDTAQFGISPEAAPVTMYTAEIYKQYLFSPDKNWVALLRYYGSQPALLDIHATSNGRLTKQTTLGYEEPTLMAFNPDGSLVAVGFENGEVKIVDFESDEIIHTIQAHVSPITAISFTQDGTQLITADDTGQIKVWGLE